MTGTSVARITFAAIGTAALLLLTGMETDLSLIRKTRRAAFSASSRVLIAVRS